MRDIPSQPSTPAEWLEYSQSEIVTSIPLRQEKRSEQNTAIDRDVYLDESSIANQSVALQYLYADVFAFTQPVVTISPPAYAEIQILARVLTADQPVHLQLAPDAAGCRVWIFASTLDQPVSVSLVDDAQSTILELGPDTGNIGVRLSVFPDKINVEYQKVYHAEVDEDLQAHLDTQLRISLALFWRGTSLAIPICSYVAALTADPALYPLLNAQAVALGQQLAAQAMTGPDMSYAPVLNVNQYLPGVHDALIAVSAFEEQYSRFQDKESTLNDQIAAWNVLLQASQTQLSLDINLSNTAYAKYQDSCTVVSRCQEQLQANNRQIDDTKSAFLEGLGDWYAKWLLIAAFKTLSAMIKFASGIGILTLGISSGMGGALSDIKDAVDDVVKAEKEEHQEGKTIPSSTLKRLGDCMQALEMLYPTTAERAQAVKERESDPNADIPSFGDVTGSSDGDADSRAIITLAAWETWCLDSDQQLEYAVGQGIRGAKEYQLALRKQAVDGKALAQAEAEAVKAGHEYVQAGMEVIGCNEDISALKALLAHYQGEKEMYAQAEARFFSRVLALRTSLVLQMQKLVWAYKYRALADSSVILDSQKPTMEFKADLSTLEYEMQLADEKYASDFQPFNWTVASTDLPANYGELLIKGLQSEKHSASFTLAPTLDPADSNSFASVFVDGSHFRLDGLETFLTGVVPRPEAIRNGVVQVDIDILTSGVYADIQDGKVFHFTSLPRGVRLSYDMTESGETGETHIHAIFPTEEHAEPTPFTQWTIKLRNPEMLDLTGLSGMELHWSGHARYVDKRVSTG
ncbi:hypothetical protein MW887_000924 [Aspergillus wentii]|nr:hypothetical protein MW887_000924 [Aspergillus wentii]